MDDWLPSLNALRAFEAVCRHLNFVHAADELHVTPAAVKQLVRKLEETVGRRLVVRQGRGLAITEAGRAGFEGLSGGFAQIQRSVSRMRNFSERRRLIVTVEPSFATAWLVPRLEGFRRNNPETDVLIDSSPALADLARGEADAAIRFGAAAAPGLNVTRLFDETLCAFCSPGLAASAKLHSIADLQHVTLIHWDTSSVPWASSTRRWMGWGTWLAATGANHTELQRGITFGDYNLAVQAAIAGQGVVLGSMPLLRGAVEAKLLVSPFREAVHTDVGYDLVTTAKAMERSEVRQFAEWMVAEAGVYSNRSGA